MTPADIRALLDGAETARSNLRNAAPDLARMALEQAAEIERLRDACNQSRLAFAGFASYRSATDKLDALGDAK